MTNSDKKAQNNVIIYYNIVIRFIKLEILYYYCFIIVLIL